MKLTKQQVQHVATLARIGLTDAEVTKFQTQLSGILDYVEQLNEVNTDGVEPTAQVTGLTNVTREDEVRAKGQSASPPKDGLPVACGRKTGFLANEADLLKSSPLPIEDNQIKVKNVF